MKKVLFVAHVQSHIVNFHLPFIQNFQKQGFEVHAATKLDINRYKGIIDDNINAKWINVDFNRSPFSLKNIKALNQLIKLMRKNKYDLIHVHTPIGGILGRIAALITNTKRVIYTAHGFHFYKGAPMINWLIYYPIERIMARITDCLITINQEDYNIAKSFNVRGNMVYNVNGVGVNYDIENIRCIDIREELKILKEDFVIGMIGELNKNKNQLQLIQAVADCIKYNNNIKVLLAGEGPMEYILKDKVIELGIKENVIFLGWRNDIYNVLICSDIICSFSKREGLPKNVIEAMAFGKPVIATNIRGNKDLIVDDFNGYLVGINDYQDTIEKINSLVEDKEKINVFSRNTSKLYNKYKLEEILIKMDEIYTINLRI